MITLLDVNVLIALAWPNHIYHRAARVWFDKNRSDGWATCPVTQSAFVRISSNSKVIPEARSPQEALLLLQRIVELPNHHFWVDDTAIATSRHLDPKKLLGFRQVADAHLLALALRRGGRIATFDRGLPMLIPSGEDSRRVAVLEPLQ